MTLFEACHSFIHIGNQKYFLWYSTVMNAMQMTHKFSDGSPLTCA